MCQCYTPRHVLRVLPSSFSLNLKSFVVLPVGMRQFEHAGDATRAPGLLEREQKQAQNPGQWALSRHRHVSSIYTFNYSFSFQHFRLLESSATKNVP